MKLAIHLHIPVTRQQITASALKTIKHIVKPVQSTGGSTVTSSGCVTSGSMKKGSLEQFKLHNMLVENSTRDERVAASSPFCDSSMVLFVQHTLAVSEHWPFKCRCWKSQPDVSRAVISPSVQQSQHIWTEGGEINLRRKTNAKMLTWWRTTLESLASQGSPGKNGTSQAPCPRAMLIPLRQRCNSFAAEQHCSWAILQAQPKK